MTSIERGGWILTIVLVVLTLLAAFNDLLGLTLLLAAPAIFCAFETGQARGIRIALDLGWDPPKELVDHDSGRIHKGAE